VIGGRKKERATGVEPATSGLGSYSTTGRKTTSRGDDFGIGRNLGGLRFLWASLDPTEFHSSTGTIMGTEKKGSSPGPSDDVERRRDADDAQGCATRPLPSRVGRE